MQIRRLTPADAKAFQALRLAALQEAPTAFASSYEEERQFGAAAIEDRLAARPDRGVLGVFVDGELVGLAALGRESMAKLAHKAYLWGMYVAPRRRGQGLGRALVLAVLELARTVPGLRQVNLGVNAGNVAAIRLYESVGFKAFGCEPGAMRVDGASHDELHMSLRLGDG